MSKCYSTANITNIKNATTPSIYGYEPRSGDLPTLTLDLEKVDKFNTEVKVQHFGLGDFRFSSGYFNVGSIGYIRCNWIKVSNDVKTHDGCEVAIHF